MIVSKEGYFYSSFVLTNKDVCELATSFEQFADRPQFVVEFREGTDRRFDDLPTLLSFEHTCSQTIRALWIWSTNDRTMSRARIRFSAVHAPVYLDIAGQTEAVDSLRTAVTRRIEAMRPRYLLRSRFDFALAGLSGLSATLAAFSAATMYTARGRTGGGESRGEMFLVETAYLILSLGAGWLANRPPGGLFPKAAFALGRGRLRQNAVTLVRWGVLGALWAAVLAGTISNLAI